MPRFVRGASLASLTIAFGLVTISVCPYSVTKRSTAAVVERDEGRG
jgi:hypothetical protein